MPDELVPRLRFNCFLIRSGIEDPESALSPRYREAGTSALARIEASAGAPDGAVAYFATHASGAPKWAKEMARIFPGVEAATSVTNRLVVFLPVGTRRFALCFGYGSSVLEWSAIEPNFGLRYAARVLKADELREVRSRRIDASARSQQVHVTAGGSLADLDTQLDGEFVRRLAGKLTDGAGATLAGEAIIASDSVSFRADSSLEDIGATLQEMLTIVEEKDASQEFEFVDALEPLRASSDLVTGLEEQLVIAIASGVNVPSDVEGVATLEFAFPDSVTTDDVQSVKMIRNSKEVTVPGFSVSAIREALAELGGRFGRASLRSVKLVALDDEGQAVSPLMPLRDWLVYEVVRGARQYILTLGRWFSLKQTFTDQLNRDLAKIADATDELALPDWTSGTEGEYNLAMTGDSWAVLDRRKMYVDGDEIESCDLFSDRGHLVHVKRYESSQTLSHLFSQGFVSVTVLNGEAAYKEQFVAAVTELNPGLTSAAERAPEHVVYAIGAPATRRIPGDLPTFSKVNLRDFARRVRQAGARVSTAHIIKPQ